jgi:hypothetical protein
MYLKVLVDFMIKILVVVVVVVVVVVIVASVMTCRLVFFYANHLFCY